MNFKVVYNDGFQTKGVLIEAVSMRKVRKLFHSIYPRYFTIYRVEKEEQNK